MRVLDAGATATARPVVAPPTEQLPQMEQLPPTEQPLPKHQEAAMNAHDGHEAELPMHLW